MPRPRATSTGRPTPADYRTLSDLRYQIRRFLRRREVAARAADVEPQQYLVLLHVKGLDGSEPATIHALAERLQIQQHGVVQLVDRLARRRMVERRRDAGDRRHVVVGLLPKGESLLRRLAVHSIAELKAEGPALVSSLTRLVVQSTRDRRSARTGRRGRER
jgi:DNA-binding MarR family transcriptional regulator